MITYTKTYTEPPFNISEIMRYAGERSGNENTKQLINECIEEIRDKLVYKVCYRKFNITKKDGVLDLGFIKTASADLMRNLDGAKEIIVFAATVGIEIDRYISKNRLSPVRALMFQAIGAERIEALCDEFTRDLKLSTKPRFSPGYGDFPLETQKEIFAVLDPQRKIGLTLNESLLMSPSKSVTAIIGICNTPCDIGEKCSLCNKTDCTYRRTI